MNQDHKKVSDDEADISDQNDEAHLYDDEDFESETMNISQNSEDIDDELSSKGVNLNIITQRKSGISIKATEAIK